MPFQMTQRLDMPMFCCNKLPLPLIWNSCTKQPGQRAAGIASRGIAGPCDLLIFLKIPELKHEFPTMYFLSRLGDAKIWSVIKWFQMIPNVPCVPMCFAQSGRTMQCHSSVFVQLVALQRQRKCRRMEHCAVIFNTLHMFWDCMTSVKERAAYRDIQHVPEKLSMFFFGSFCSCTVLICCSPFSMTHWEWQMVSCWVTKALNSIYLILSAGSSMPLCWPAFTPHEWCPILGAGVVIVIALGR